MVPDLVYCKSAKSFDTIIGLFISIYIYSNTLQPYKRCYNAQSQYVHMRPQRRWLLDSRNSSASGHLIICSTLSTFHYGILLLTLSKPSFGNFALFDSFILVILLKVEHFRKVHWVILLCTFETFIGYFAANSFEKFIQLFCLEHLRKNTIVQCRCLPRFPVSRPYPCQRQILAK